MEDITVSSEIHNIVIENLPKIITDSFSGYSSPVKKTVDDAIKEKEGEIKKLVDTILKDILTDPAFRIMLGEKILELVIVKGLRN